MSEVAQAEIGMLIIGLIAAISILLITRQARIAIAFERRMTRMWRDKAYELAALIDGLPVGGESSERSET